MRQGFAIWAAGLTMALCLFGVWSSRSIDASRQANTSLNPDRVHQATPEKSSGSRDQRSARQQFRAEELRRRPQQPTGDFPEYEGVHRANYAQLLARRASLTPEVLSRVAKTSLMPATACQSVELVPDEETDPFWAAQRAHRDTFAWFSSQAGFGQWRMGLEENERGITMGNGWVDRVELVSLLLHKDPGVYVLDEIATMELAHVAQFRPLDEFEQRGLDAVRAGAELVWTREAPHRMFGAIRASSDCLDCHSGARENELLGGVHVLSGASGRQDGQVAQDAETGTGTEQWTDWVLLIDLTSQLAPETVFVLMNEPPAIRHCWPGRDSP